jgi:hypothetical protein
VSCGSSTVSYASLKMVSMLSCVSAFEKSGIQGKPVSISR